MDQQTLEPLKNANVVFHGGKHGSITNEEGEFVFSVTTISASDSLKISFMGYETLFVPLTDFKSGETLTLLLEPTLLRMPEIDIVAKRLSDIKETFSIEPSPRFLSLQDLEKIPAVTGLDIHRALQTLPGITTTNEVSSQFNVRGGNFDQNLLLLDGAVVYYPYHYMGIVSAFNGDMIDELILSQGGFSSRYGDRLSSVLCLQSRKPDENFPNRINLSATGADMTIGHKIGKKLGWMVSARTSYYDVIGRLLEDAYPFYYYDVFAKLEYEINSNNLFRIFTYQNRDAQDIKKTDKGFVYSSTDSDKKEIELIDKDEIAFQNRLVSLVWENQYSEALNWRCQFTKSLYKNFFDKQKYAVYPDNLGEKYTEDKNKIENKLYQENQLSKVKIANNLKDHTFTFSTTWNPSTSTRFETGLQVTRLNFDYGWKGTYEFWEPFVNLFFDYSPQDYFVYHKSVQNKAAYIESLWKINDRLRLRQGIRFTKWDFMKKVYLEPRLNMQYILNKNLSVKMAYGFYTQGVSTCLEEGLIGFLELYFPNEAGDNIERAKHFILNLDYKNKKGTGFQVSCYYKPFKNLLKSVDNEQRFTQTNGVAYGVELEASAKIINFDTAISYVWSHSQRAYNGIDYDTNFDQRHRVQISAARDLGKHWSLSLYWICHSGQPYNPGRYLALYRGVDYMYFRNERYYDVYGIREMDAPRGRIRYPFYHRLDISLSKIFSTSKFSWSPYLAIRNAYCRKNVLYYRNLEYHPDSENDKWVDPDINRDPFSIPILPTIGVRFEF